MEDKNLRFFSKRFGIFGRKEREGEGGGKWGDADLLRSFGRRDLAQHLVQFSFHVCQFLFHGRPGENPASTFEEATQTDNIKNEQGPEHTSNSAFCFASFILSSSTDSCFRFCASKLALFSAYSRFGNFSLRECDILRARFASQQTILLPMPSPGKRK